MRGGSGREFESEVVVEEDVLTSQYHNIFSFVWYEKQMLPYLQQSYIDAIEKSRNKEG